jgi:hypothetical protein
MEHFHALLLQADAILKLHAVAAVSVLSNFDQEAAKSLGFDLARSGGGGTWVASIRIALERVHPFLTTIEEVKLVEWLGRLHVWLLSKRKRDDAEDLTELLLELRAFRNQLAGDESVKAAGTRGAPIDLLDLLVEVRNKTTGHAAYGPDFYRAHVTTIAAPVSWLVANTPLWDADLTVERSGEQFARCLAGLDPTRTRSLERPFDVNSTVCVLPGSAEQDLVPLIHIEPSDNHTYLANGNWRDSDSTTEFLCHALEAAHPEQGKRRIEMAEYAIRPAVSAASETQELGRLRDEPGVALNNLPVPAVAYVPRPDLEERLGPMLTDADRRHLITVRGHGGIGKTSLVLAQCRELVQNGADSPYDAVLWFSARDIDLTIRGPKEVKRSTGTLADVWRRFSEVFGGYEHEAGAAKEFFEASLRENRLLIVLDNFETFDNQRAAYDYFDAVVYPPSKVVITSRHDFQADTTVQVDSMSWDEASRLLVQTARQAGAEPLMTNKVQSAIFERCRGHPYAMKLAAARLKTQHAVISELPSVLRDERLLEALFRSSIEDLEGDEEAVFVFLMIGQFESGLSEPALRVVSEARDVSVDAAVRELALRSLIELRADASPWPTYDMPAMAREFARKLIRGHVLNAEVMQAASFVRRWPGLDLGRLGEAATAMIRDLREDRVPTASVGSVLTAMRSLAELDSDLWVMLARAQQLAGRPSTEWDTSFKRAVEENPERADILWEWSEATYDPDQQIALKVQAVTLDPSNVALASRVALLLNSLFAQQRRRYTKLRWAGLLRSAAAALETSFEDLDGEALSRLAWLYLHAGSKRGAKRAVGRGIEVDPENRDIAKLRERLERGF